MDLLLVGCPDSVGCVILLGPARFKDWPLRKLPPRGKQTRIVCLFLDQQESSASSRDCIKPFAIDTIASTRNAFAQWQTLERAV